MIRQHTSLAALAELNVKVDLPRRRMSYGQLLGVIDGYTDEEVRMLGRDRESQRSYQRRYARRGRPLRDVLSDRIGRSM